MKCTFPMAVACALATMSWQVRAADRMQPGQWELVTTTDGVAHTVSHCVSADDAASVNGGASEARKHAEVAAEKGHCALKSFDANSDSVSYTLSCGTRTIESTATYQGASYTGVLTTTDTQGTSVKTGVQGRRTGACP